MRDGPPGDTGGKVSIPDETPTPGEVVQQPLSPTEQRQLDEVLYNPDLDFRKLALDVAEVSQGFRLVDKTALEAVPHVIKRVVYRPGFPRGEKGTPGDYVSVECVVADKEALESAPIWSQIAKAQNINSIDQLTVFGGEPVIYNDSGTGLRRTLTKLFEKYSLINLGTSHKDEEPADRQFQLWAAGAEHAQDGFTGDDLGGKQAIYLALRGLRKSEYESPFGPATTWYFG
jgi:hypothetical protein